MVATAAYIAAAAAVINMASAAAAANARAREATFEGKLAQRNAEQEALLLERDAAQAEADAQQEALALEFDLETQRDLFARLAGTTRALIGASGTEFSGSNLLVAIDQARQAELSMDALRFESEQVQFRLRDEAAILSFQAEQARARGSFARDIARARARNIRRGLPLQLVGAGLSGASNVFGAQASQSQTRQGQANQNRAAGL